MRLYTCTIIVMTTAFLMACQTTPMHDFAQLKPGMEKQDVLELMGNPSRTERVHSKDKWTYIFYDQSIRTEKEVQFFEGNAVYVGDVTQPAPEMSAVAVDKKHEDQAKLEEELRQEAIAARAAKGSYSQYESEASKTDNKIRYVPDFKPIQ